MSYESLPAQQHRAAAPRSVACAVLTVSDTRTAAEDRSGDTIAGLLQEAGHRVAAREIVPDEPAEVAAAARRFAAAPDIEAVLITGGTGIAARDQTPEAIEGLLTKRLPGFGELLRMLSFQEIGAAAMLSRAVGGVMDGRVVLLMPGSTAAVRLAMEQLILPELGHLVEQARR
ncbi:MAG TPA: molybdenum cofactor biosynthesis protein B [Lacipirellulaceae bacterium]|nr:molybdenum cofactor biosynthesis protein B [Lacipirellulaceae bacterium]